MLLGHICNALSTKEYRMERTGLTVEEPTATVLEMSCLVSVELGVPGYVRMTQNSDHALTMCNVPPAKTSVDTSTTPCQLNKIA